MEGRLLFEEIWYCKTLVKLAMGYVQTVDHRISINLLSASLKTTFRPAWPVEISSL